MTDIRDEFDPPLKLRQMGNVFTEPDLAKVDPLPRCCCCGRIITGLPAGVIAPGEVQFWYCGPCGNGKLVIGQGELGI